MACLKRYSNEQVAAFDAQLAPFRGNMKVQPNGTLYFAKNGIVIGFDSAFPLIYAYQACVFDLATTFLGNVTGKFRDIGIKYDSEDSLDEKGSLIKEYRVRLYGAHMSSPIDCDRRYVFVDACSAISFEDALIRLALFYQAAIGNWVGFWNGPKDACDWFGGQLACHNQLVVLPAPQIPLGLPIDESIVATSGDEDAGAAKTIDESGIDPILRAQTFSAEESLALPSGNEDAANAMPIDDSCIDPRLLAQSLPSEESVAVGIGNEVAASGLTWDDFFIDPGLTSDWP
ncbi:uncharacterized protein CC84DRAFT_1171355 [Paraphaeosphaeria sporulosa]|uniref:Uncharacterized protein n=1 Tax=Paraphaeosphaeria sporulosa TaxID=1460663 RepID=A0A177CYP8_9PLEO|nr:uncharacterized protein CC84DRAFT_1171355 [Paraphaeosphaeria sporulosa]OAG12675.1 hypothetical protein CC84DRAFT_1171355 [Paraphaeosphaeria sporulosa]